MTEIKKESEKKNQSMGVEIIGLGHYLPERIVKNNELMHLFNAEGNLVDTKVLGDIGVTSRHWANETETVVYMAAEASKMAMEVAGITPDEVDLLLLANWTSRQFVPENAPQVAGLINAHNALAFDLCGACCGFILGVITATMYLLTNPKMKKAIVIGCDQFSKRVRPNSKGQLVVGDAAGAVVVVKSESQFNGLIDYTLQSEGSLKDVVTALPPNGWIRSRGDLIDEAVDKNMKAVDSLLKRNQLSIDDINWIVPHPGTSLVHSGIKKALGISDERFIVNFETVGNTSSASIPIVLSEYYQKGIFKKNDLFLTPAIGSGLYYGSLLFRL